MRQKLEKRLTALELELQKGNEMMARLDQERNALHNNMLRISGAIQVIKEELVEEEGKVNVIEDKEGESIE